MQQAMQMGSMPVVAPANITTEQIQKYLDENKQLILAILENQNLGKLSECAQYQAQLQKNLLYLAAIADAQPQSPAVRPQMTPPGATTPGALPPGMSPQAAAAAAAAQYMQQQGQAHLFQSRPQLAMHQEAQHLQQTPPHQMMSFPGQMQMRPGMAMNGMHHHPMHVDPSQQSGKPDGTPGASSEPDRGVSIRPCNYSDGRWVRDPDLVQPRYDRSCREIYKGWNCIANAKSNGGELVRWRWQPSQCDLPVTDPVAFLERYRDTNIGFVGDSLNRNMYISLVCMLKRGSSEVKKWRPAGADRGLMFVRYNLTLAYHRTFLLVRYGSWSASSEGGALESLGYKKGFRVDVDVPDHKWAEALKFHHILVFNTGHWWWAPSKFDPIQSPLLFFQNGVPVIPPLSPPLGLDLVLKHMLSYIEDSVGLEKILLFRTQSPRHFEGGDWNTGGSCRRKEPLSIDQVGELFSVDRNGTNVESRLVNQHLFQALKGSRFHVLDITSMSEFRADAHPSTTGGKKHEDCMHWCLPGLPDIWNDLLVATLETLQIK